MSFSLGRPDTLGLDVYHNRVLPPIDNSEFAIIPVMVQFARIIRKISVIIYHSSSSWQDKISFAAQIEQELDQWAASLPKNIKSLGLDEPPLGALKEPKWCRRQRLVLRIST